VKISPGRAGEQRPAISIGAGILMALLQEQAATFNQYR